MEGISHRYDCPGIDDGATALKTFGILSAAFWKRFYFSGNYCKPGYLTERYNISSNNTVFGFFV